MKISSANTQIGGAALLFFALTLAFFGLFFVDIDTADTGKAIFFLLNIVFFLYLAWEVYGIAHTEKWQTLLHPAVLASLYHFLGSYFIPNLRHVVNYDWHGDKSYVLLGPDVYHWLNVTMIAAILAAFAMWTGYRSHVAIRFSRWFYNVLSRKRLLRKGLGFNFGFLLFLIVLWIATAMLQVKLGIFGYSSDISRLYETKDFRAYMDLVFKAGPLVLLVLSISVFSNKYRRHLGVWLLFGIIFGSQIFLGLLSGFKSQVVWPAIIVGFGYYSMKRRIPISLIIMAFVLLVLAYQIIEPFRAARYSDSTFNSRSLTSIVETMFEATTENKQSGDYSFQWQQFASRQDIMNVSAVAVMFKSRVGLPPGSPEFLKNFIMTPLIAFVPRLVWQGKPMADTGHWFNAVVFGAGESTKSSVGYGPIGYFYFAGGYLMIFIGFWIIGACQRVIFQLFSAGNLGGLLIYLSLLPGLVIISSDVGGMLAGILRLIPFIILVQYFLIKAKSKTDTTVFKRNGAISQRASSINISVLKK